MIDIRLAPVHRPISPKYQEHLHTSQLSVIYWLLYCITIQVTHLDDFGRQLHARIHVVHPIHSTGKSAVTFIGPYISYLFTGPGWQILCSSNVWYQPVTIKITFVWCSLVYICVSLSSTYYCTHAPLHFPSPSTHTLVLTSSHSPHVHTLSLTHCSLHTHTHIISSHTPHTVSPLK